MEAVPETPPDDSSGANPSSVKSDDGNPRHESGSSSPPPNCAICLGTCRNKSFTDSCLHQFCFKCLLTWSRVKAECPLCKQNFRSIIHNVRSNHQYEEYMVEQRQTEDSLDRMDYETLAANTRRFRYRTTLTLPRRETLAIQQLLLQHYPIMADVFPSPPRALPARRRRSPNAFRRTVYRHNLWARPLPDFTGRFRDCSPEFYRYNDSQMHRLVPWLNRELHYLLNENIGHISYVISRILELLPQYHINSPEFREAIQIYFRDRTEHFLHELYCFASTPYDLTGYDRNVQYTTDTRISTMVNEVISSSESEASVDSDIVMVSSSEPAEPPPGPSRPPPPPAARPPPVRVIPIESISHSDTDDDDEVMVVGYIKPPQDRTPEVVDLLGSDSDVIVQDAPEPPPRASEERPAPLVKLILKRHDSASSSTAADAARATPSPPPPAAPASSSSSSSSDSYDPSSASDADSSSGSAGSGSRRRRARRRVRRRRDAARRQRRQRAGKRKSASGRGVKTSQPPAAAAPAADQPGSSRRRRRSPTPTRETKRLRSVVNVMYNQPRPDGAGAGGSGAPRAGWGGEPAQAPVALVRNAEVPSTSRVDNSDSDDLPLNLSVQKTYLSL